MKKLMELPLTLATVQAWHQPALEELIKGHGDQPDAVLDFIGMHFTAEGTRLIVVVYHNLSTWEQGIPLPGFPSFELNLTRAEHLALAQQNQSFADLETAVRDAAWSLMTTHPKMLRGATPVEGQQDTRHNVFAAGALTEV